MTTDEWLALLDSMGCPPRPDEWDDPRWITRGTWILDHGMGQECPSQVDQLNGICAAIDHWREVVSDCGQCHPEGCCEQRKILNNRGEIVCKRTKVTCVQDKLSGIVELWSKLGRHDDEQQGT